jgi:hypothetical protein
MTSEKTQQLFDAFPSLYRGRVKPIEESLMSFGFECGDGWFDLILALSQKIEDATRAVGLEPQSDEWPEAIQVKQKFGSLRFYLKNPCVAMTEEAAALIREAEAISAKTCEICGNPGSREVGRRLKTLCDIHAK